MWLGASRLLRNVAQLFKDLRFRQPYRHLPTPKTVLLPLVDLPRLAIRGLDQKDCHEGGESAVMFLMESGVGVPEVVAIGVMMLVMMMKSMMGMWSLDVSLISIIDRLTSC